MPTETQGTPDEGEILAEFPKNRREVVRVRRVKFHGRECIDVRAFFPGEGDEWRPGKGLAVAVEKLPELQRALRTAAATLKGGKPEAEPPE